MQSEDGELIKKCLEGEPEVFGILVDKYKESVYGLIHARVLDFHHSQDLTQEVFIKAFEKLHTLKRHDNFRAWLYTIIHRVCINWFRDRSRKPKTTFLNEKTIKKLDEKTRTRYQSNKRLEETVDLIHNEIKKLPLIYRQIVTLHYLNEMDNREIATYLGISPNNVSQRLKRANSILRKNLDVIRNHFKEKELPEGFTFRILEDIKHIKHNPLPRIVGLPLGMGLTSSLVFMILGISAFQIYDNLNRDSNTQAVVRQNPASKDEEIYIQLIDESEIPTVSDEIYNANSISIKNGSDIPMDTSLAKKGFTFHEAGWGKYGNNPVVSGSKNMHTLSPSVIYHKDIYMMWYSECSMGTQNSEIKYAVSKDGINWFNHITVMKPEEYWERDGITKTSVILDKYETDPEKRYKMWYIGIRPYFHDIGYATSPDGIRWTKYSNNPVIPYDIPNGTISPGLGNVVVENSIYSMWFSAKDNEDKHAIYRAISFDGIIWEQFTRIKWTENTENGQWDSLGQRLPFIIKENDNNRYHMWYVGDDYIIGNCVGYAASEDGLKWEKYPDNPILTPGENKSWDGNSLGNMSVLLKDDVCNIWYAGNSDNNPSMSSIG
ncbi:sigma-70 family RNA polymerase sigma factor, partial [Candidatus Poribacteria bacterium]|nr:sigma-70 family RNA polymerase sigma factor [Candidatus Poribacteria bacterium]